MSSFSRRIPPGAGFEIIDLTCEAPPEKSKYVPRRSQMLRCPKGHRVTQLPCMTCSVQRYVDVKRAFLRSNGRIAAVPYSST